jgi:hypothetical protein
MVTIKSLLIMMFFIAVIVISYFSFVYDGIFDTVKNNYLTPNQQIASYAEKIRATCNKWQSQDCYALEAKTFTENIRYRNDTWLQTTFQWDNDVNYTLKNGNDCDGIAVFGASLLHELGVRDIYVLEENSNGTRTDHVSIGARTEDGSLIVINSQRNFEIIKIRKLE